MAGGRAVASRSSKKEFRTSVILTETQFKQVRELAREHDVSIAWVLRQAVDRYLAIQVSKGRDAVEQAPGANE
ncbi:MAG: ribbon-helix-helix protein, CopG family [Rhizobiaceae bacterium]|nr:ribbon-helix-helix protein, CopG family [Rhizobiaceae bacterium]